MKKDTKLEDKGFRKKDKIHAGVFYLVLVLIMFVPLVSSEGIYSTKMSENSMHMADASGQIYNGKTYLTGQATGNAQGDSYQANVGYFGKAGIVKQKGTNNQITITGNKTITGGHIYSVKTEIKDSQGNYLSSSSTPIIRLYDPLGNLIVNDDYAAFISTGVYQYNFAISTAQTPGQWKTQISVIVDGVTEDYIEYWELLSPTEVRITSISDNTVPTITANVIITNEGNVDFEYSYEYCITSMSSASCGGSTDIDYGTGAKLIKRDASWNVPLTLEVPQIGQYWFKITVHYGSQKSKASKSFTVVYGTNINPPVSGETGGGLTTITPTPSTVVPMPTNIMPKPSERGVINPEPRYVTEASKKMESGGKITLSIDVPVIKNSEIPNEAGSAGSSSSSQTESHTVEVSSVGTDRVTLKIYSEPITVDVKINEEKDVDVNNDGLAELKIRLNSIVNKKADITIKKLDVSSLYEEITGNAITRPGEVMDVIVKMIEEFKIVEEKTRTMALITLYNMGTEEVADAFIEYSLIGKNETFVLDGMQDSIAVQTKAQIVKRINLPLDLKEGSYMFRVKVNYLNHTAEGSDNFDVFNDSPSLWKVGKTGTALFPIVCGFLIFAVFIGLKREKKPFSKRKRRKKISLPQKKVAAQEETEQLDGYIDLTNIKPAKNRKKKKD